jgi:GSH-dependent disulfide-bond oxidoreductase
LEELGLPYEVHSIDVSRGETRTPQFLTLNPNGKIPAIIDPDGPDGTPIALFESGAMFAGREIDDKRPLERFRSEAQRLLGVLEQQLEDREWLMGDTYTIADISLIGWVRSLTTLIDADLKSVPAWLQRCLARVAVQRGLNIPPRA